MSSGPSWRNENPRCGLVQLHRRDAEIEGDAGDGPGRKRPEQPLHVAERAGDQGQPAAVAGGERLAARDRLGVTVNAEDTAARGAEERFTIAAGAEGSVDIDRIVARRQRSQHRLGEHRYVPRSWPGTAVIAG